MNLYERYPEANASLGKTTLYEEVKVGSALMHGSFLPGQKLAIAKLHTNVPAWGPCPPHEKGPCVSKTETKATYAMARTLAQLARVHVAEKQTEAARKAFALAKPRFRTRGASPALPRLPGLRRGGRRLPDNTSTPSGARRGRTGALPPRPGQHRGRCLRGPRQVFLASRALGDPGAVALAGDVAAHPLRRDRPVLVDVGRPDREPLAPRPAPEGIDLGPISKGLFAHADACVTHMAVGYPGVTFDAKSDRWDSGDRDELDNNWRWGSSRLLLDDAVVLAVAAEEKARAGDRKAAAAYARHAVAVMDWILGTNAMALSMVTGFGENAVERLHDSIVPDGEPGRMALGPNNWTPDG